jgi:peptidoglycan DL-endopeptidase CwlO
MPHTPRALLVLFALTLSMAFALLKPLAGRAAPNAKAPTTTRKLASAKAASAMSRRVVSYARRFLGVRYVYGGSSPRSGFDCSGFVRYVYAHFGVSLPHSSYAQWNMGVSVPRDQLQPGDLVFFDGLGHVGLYIGGGLFVHAPHTGTVVQVSSLDGGWYAASYVGARRIL